MLAAGSTAFFGFLGLVFESAVDPCIGGGCRGSAQLAFALTAVAQAGLLAAVTWLATRRERTWFERTGACVAAALLAPVVLLVGSFLGTSLAVAG